MAILVVTSGSRGDGLNGALPLMEGASVGVLGVSESASG